MTDSVSAKMYEAVFISDLHLHPDDSAITNRFIAFVEWAAKNTAAVYILGDFFHAWAGDEDINPWSCAIAQRLFWLSQQKVAVYFMPGNRDFLLGKRFAAMSGIIPLAEPMVIQLVKTKILLVHGDRYCIKDKSHQWFRMLTRNYWFAKIFLRIPYKIRVKIVQGVRQQSQKNTKPASQMGIILQPMIQHMQQQKVNIVIHGHVHTPEFFTHTSEGEVFHQYILSDWDDKPKILCYDNSKGLIFTQYI